MHNSEDIILYEHSGSRYIWPHRMHETLILTIYFTYINKFTWEMQRTNLLVGVARDLWGVTKKYHTLGGYLMSQLFQKTRGIDALPFSKLYRFLSHEPRSCFYSK